MNIEEIKAKNLDTDAEILHQAALALVRNGTSDSSRLVSDIRRRRDEWQDQADAMRQRAAE